MELTTIPIPTVPKKNYDLKKSFQVRKSKHTTQHLILLFAILLIPFQILSQENRKVLVIGIDGCRPDALQSASTPYLDQLKENGLFSPDALNDDITISGPGWSAILCGVWSDKHLVTGNGFEIDNYDQFPSFIKRVENYNPEIHTVSICHWAPINDLIIQDYADFKLNVSSDFDVANQASAYLSVNDPDLMFLHFDEADGIGHAFGFSPQVPQYISIIEQIDSYIGTVIQAIEDRPNYANEDWLIMLTTDHGGLGTSHGGSSIEEENVFLIASGNDIDQQIITKDSTIIFQEITNCLGDSIELVFDGVNDFVSIPVEPIFDFGSDENFSIECRVRTTESADVAIVGNKDWSSGLNKGFVFSFEFPSGPNWKVNIGDGTNRADINNGGQIADNQWHTLTVTFDRSGFMKMYQDGEFIDSTDISFIEDINTGMGLFFGTDINSSFDYNGAIAEVRVWSGILTAANIQEWSCKPLESSHSQYETLIGYWKVNESTGNILTDFSPNNNSGEIIDAIWEQPESSITTFNYDKTPRITDIPPSVFDHLCIPIDPLWNLDGQSLVSNCTTTNTTDVHEQKGVTHLLVSPNPASEKVSISFDGNIAFGRDHLEIYNSNGVKVDHHIITNEPVVIELTRHPDGLYLIKLIQEDICTSVEKLVLLK